MSGKLRGGPQGLTLQDEFDPKEAQSNEMAERSNQQPQPLVDAAA